MSNSIDHLAHIKKNDIFTKLSLLCIKNDENNIN